MHSSVVRVTAVAGALVMVTAVVASLGTPQGDPADAATVPAGLTIAGSPVDGASVVADAEDRFDAHRATQRAADTAALQEQVAQVQAAAAALRGAAAEARRQAAAQAARQAREVERARVARAAARDPRGLGRLLAADRGWSASQWGCLEALWTKESNWRWNADNPTSSAYGIPQALPGSKMSGAGSDWRTNPATQIEWGLGYIADRYGTPCGAWSHSKAHNWY